MSEGESSNGPSLTGDRAYHGLACVLLGASLLTAGGALILHDASVYPSRGAYPWWTGWFGWWNASVDGLGSWLETWVTLALPATALLVAVASILHVRRSWRSRPELAGSFLMLLTVALWSWAACSLPLQAARWASSSEADLPHRYLLHAWTPGLGAVAVAVGLVAAWRAHSLLGLGVATLISAQSAANIATVRDLATLNVATGANFVESSWWGVNACALWLSAVCFVAGVAVAWRTAPSALVLQVRFWLPHALTIWLATANFSMLSMLEERAAYARLQQALSTHPIALPFSKRAPAPLRFPFAVVERDGGGILVHRDRAVHLRTGDVLPRFPAATLSVLFDDRATVADLGAFLERLPLGQKIALVRPALRASTSSCSANAAVEAANARVASVPIYFRGDNYPQRALREGLQEPVKARAFELSEPSLALRSLPADVDYLLARGRRSALPTRPLALRTLPPVNLAGSTLFRLHGERWLVPLIAVLYAVLLRVLGVKARIV